MLSTDPPVDGVLVVDFGTSGVHVSVINCRGGESVLGFSKKYPLLHPAEGMAELRPQDVWRASQECVARTVEGLPGNVRLRALSFSWFGDSVMAVDGAGEPMTNLLLCFDARGVAEAAEIAAALGPRHAELTGEPCNSSSASSKLLWLKRHMPGVFKGAAKFWSVQQFVLHRLGLEPVCDATMAARFCLFDNRSRRWSPELAGAAGLDLSRLPRVESSGYAAGTIRNYGAVPLPDEVPVMIGAHDCECGILGVGAFGGREDVLADITGTYDHLGFLRRGYLNPLAEDPGAGAYGASGPLEDTSTCSASFDTAGSTLEWFMREVAGDTSPASYDALWASAEFSGSGRLLLCPDFIDSHGRVSGLDISTTRRDLFAAVVEGITFEVRGIFDAFQRLTGGGISVLRVGGGLSRADKWLQLRADVFGCRVERMANPESSSLGAAILGASAAGVYSDAEAAAEGMVFTAGAFVPRPATAARYAGKYESYRKFRDKP